MESCDPTQLYTGLATKAEEYPAMARPARTPWTFSVRYGCNPPIPFHPGSRRFPAPPNQDPLAIFKPMINLCTSPGVRWVKVDPRKGGSNHAVLLFVDGAASNDGKPDAVRAGFGVMFTPETEHDGVSFPLEKVPGVELTSNRAELRAAHAALGLRAWGGEGFETIVIATDSEYVVKGVNEWVAKWKRNGWKTSTKQDVKNKDLWMALLDSVEEYEEAGIAVQFYLIERRFNKADALAKKAAASVIEVPEQTAKLVLLGV